MERKASASDLSLTPTNPCVAQSQDFQRAIHFSAKLIANENPLKCGVKDVLVLTFPITAARLTQLVERLTAEREVMGSIPRAGPILRVLK